MESFAEILDAEMRKADKGPHATPLADALAQFDVEIAGAGLDVPSWARELRVGVACSDDELRRAWKMRALETHPDRPGGSQEAFIAAQRALTRAETERLPAVRPCPRIATFVESAPVTRVRIG